MDSVGSLVNNIAVLEEDLYTQFNDISRLENNIKQFNDQLVLVVATEISPEINDTIRKLNYPNVRWLIPGALNNYHPDMSLSYQWHIQLVKESNTVPNINLLPRTYYFDVLLGTKKFHRDYIHSHTYNSNYFITSYYGNNLNNTNFIWPDDITGTPATSTENVMFNGKSTRLSCIIPTNIYQQTAYSIVAETYYDNEFSFFTEKIAKPLLSGRLFIVFSGFRYLENLRKLGFKTFDGIIDEGYDTVEDHQQRFKQAIDQVQYLCTQDQVNILEKIKPIVEHNQQLLISKDWSKDFINHL